MNNRQKGYYRDKAILNAIFERYALDTEQVRCLYFPTKYGRRKAQERLLKLYKKGKLKREKVNDIYAYYIEKPGMIKHTLAVNWVRIWFEKKAKSWEKVYFYYEKDYKILRCDGFVAVKNTVTGGYKFYFVELDRGTNKFDKVEKYNKLFDDCGYDGDWWVKLTDKFPQVVIVTTSRVEKIKELIKERNTNNLRFEVYLLDDIKEGIK